MVVRQQLRLPLHAEGTWRCVFTIVERLISEMIAN